MDAAAGGAAAHPANELAILAGLLLCATVTGSLSNEALLARHFHYPTLLGVLGPLATAISGAAAYAHGGWTRKAPLGAHFACGVVIFISVWCGARSQLYLPFAIFLGAKSARLVATMGVGAVWLNKRYSSGDVACACLAIVGLALALGLARPPRDPHDPAVAAAAAAALGDDDDAHADGGGGGGSPLATFGRGHVLIAISLLADGVVSNHQEALMWQHGTSSQELSALSHGTACGLMLLSALFDGHTLGGLADAAASPRLLGWLAVLAVSGWASTLLVLSIMAGYGNARASFILTCAKALAVGVSLAILPKPVDPSQLVGITLVLASVMASTLIKHHPTAAAAAAAAAKDSEADTPLAGGDDDDVDVHAGHEGGDIIDTTALSGRAASGQLQLPLPSPPPLHRFATIGSALDAAIPEADNETVATYEDDDDGGAVSPQVDDLDGGGPLLPSGGGGAGARPAPQRPVLDVPSAVGGGSSDYNGDSGAVTPPLRSADRLPPVGAASVLARSTSAPTAEQRAVASGVALASAGAPRNHGGRRRRIASSQDLAGQVSRADTVGAALPPSAAALAAGSAASASAPLQTAATGSTAPPARRPSLSLTHVRTASSRTLQRIATASRLALDALSEVGGVERPAVVYDSLSPGARPAVIYSFAGGGGGGGQGTGAAATRRSVRSFRLDGSPATGNNSGSGGSQGAGGR